MALLPGWSPRQLPRHRYPEAFKWMLYRCPAGHEEWIWNSRDGVTPFVVDCRVCHKNAQHADWHRDLYMPGFNPVRGER